MHLAAIAGHSKVMDVLLSNGANLDDKDIFEQSPLDCALKCNKVASVKFLLERGITIPPHKYFEEYQILFPELPPENPEKPRFIHQGDAVRVVKPNMQIINVLIEAGFNKEEILNQINQHIECYIRLHAMNSEIWDLYSPALEYLEKPIEDKGQ